jgi:hypothetical protein
MALQALAAYTDQPAAAEAVKRGLAALEKLEFSGAENAIWGANSSESAAQAVVAKTALGADASASLSELLEYRAADGGFSHEKGGSFDLMSSEQALCALVAWDRSLTGAKALYNMTDIGITLSRGGFDGDARPGEITVFLDGKILETGGAPVNADGRILVPMRAVFEAMGADVSWSGEDLTVSARTAGHSLSFAIDGHTAQIDGQARFMDAPARLIDGNTMVPLRFVSESLDAVVSWYGASKTVVLESASARGAARGARDPTGTAGSCRPNEARSMSTTTSGLSSANG